MKTNILLAAMLFVAISTVQAQWTIGAGMGASFPITGYGEVIEPGTSIFNLHVNRSLGKGNLAVGAIVQMNRFSKDKNPADAFHGAKLTVAPVLFTLSYHMNQGGIIQPYVTGGLGLSFFAVSYNSSPTEIDDQSVFNVSFTMMPAAGLQIKASNHIYPFIETGMVLLMDGPPVGFPEGEKITGYQFLSVGVNYRFAGSEM